MKRTVVVLTLLVPFLVFAQPRIKDKKYPSLLWEISGNGLSKTSYLFGTMHVSSKLAFHLADSFYIGIRKADVVALETNPESWQEDMSKYDLDNNETSYQGQSDSQVPDQYFRKSSLQFGKYIPFVEYALSSNPSSINSLLYRTYGDEESDFEEDTYLDMYIYQCGKKWGKKVAGVEQYGESMRLMSEAYRDAAKDKNKRPFRYDQDNEYSGNRLQEAYRTGNLDWLDSINKYNSFSEAFDEKFMYRRNEIQSASIDSILRTGNSLFVGVGAAHLPGNRGVIEMLRRKGYKLRPVKMGARDSEHKNQVEKIRVPVLFSTRSSADSFFRVDAPGKLFDAGEAPGISQQQYADMSNGSYYMVTRVETNAWMWNQSTQRVKAIVDSLLYENIPGRIIRRTAVTRDGYPGIDLVNKTRRGDMQRYHIFVTPLEVIIFKMSGTADYVVVGTEADRFFNSIRFRSYQPATAASSATAASPATWSPASGGFRASFPHLPLVANRGRWTYDAADPENGLNYRIVRHDIHNYTFTDEDSFDLSMMEESFGSSEFIDKKIESSYGNTKGYPFMDARYSDKSGGVYQVRYLIQGPHYYTVIARAGKASSKQKDFINSFAITPYRYGPLRTETDTILHFTVQIPQGIAPKKEKIDIGNYQSYDDDPELNDGSVSRARVIRSDSTGELVTVSYGRMSDYDVLKDSAMAEFSKRSSLFDSSRIIRRSLSGDFSRNGRFLDVTVSDSGSSRCIRMKLMFVNGNGFLVMAESDTLSSPGSFVETFFDSFHPADSLAGIDAYASKTARFFRDLYSADTIAHKKAVKALGSLEFEESDLPELTKAIYSLSYNEKRYLEVKSELIGKLESLQSKASTDLLRNLYVKTADTLYLQHSVLETLLDQETDYSFKTFRDLVVADPPVLDAADPGLTDYQVTLSNIRNGAGDDSFLSGLNDSLELSRNIIQDLLPLLNLEDYEPRIRRLLATLVDSNLARPKLYESFYSKFLLQAKQKLKTKLIAEKQARIAKAESKKDESDNDEAYAFDYTGYSGITTMHSELGDFCSLLLPFYDSKADVRAFFNQLFATSDDDLKMQTMFKLIKAGKPYPDTLLNHFASDDKYRYALFEELKETGNGKLFPAKFNNQVALARGFLYRNSGSPIDSMVYLARLPARIQRINGDVLFFKYKTEKGERWLLATVGLLPADTTVMQFEQDRKTGADSNDGLERAYRAYGLYNSASYKLNDLGTTKLNDELPLMEQLRKHLRKIIFSSHRSGSQFYTGQKKDEPDPGEEEEAADTNE